ncbi:c-type cytochrome [Cupriavidus sp. IDO]|uniref:c-type cytochrome n=1 Tax=Cupriavidus sp. IDO TaxID=1539142 RepID=UPI000579132F|nr:c-type cytochrome [Cupriavidus sp. IDO]KWR75042.1 cytochrome C [Cupriavidus sp. IDO]
MKRALVIVAAVAGVVGLGAAAFSGPDLLDYYRFDKALDSHLEASQAEGGAWPQLQESCFSCHGPRGQSRNGHYPALSGLPASYIEAQLRAFSSEQRHSPTMGPLARSLTEGQIKLLAAYYARQAPAGHTSAPASAALEERGRTAVQASSCQACHGDGLVGKDLAPRLAGQGEIYLANQLAAFKAGERRDPSGAMNGIAAALSNEDIPAVASYLSRIPTGQGGSEVR